MTDTRTFDQIMWEAEQQVAERHSVVEEPPRIRLFDGNCNNEKIVGGYISCEFTWRYNDVGSGSLVLPRDHYLIPWLIDERERGAENIIIDVRKNGKKWSGTAQSVVYEKDEDGSECVVVTFADDIAELQYVRCQPNPFTPVNFQYPKYMVIAAPARYGLKLVLHLNLTRLNMNFWQPADNPLSLDSWLQALRPWDWNKLVVPQSLVLDDSEWCIINTRFDDFLSMAQPILQETGLMLTYNRWFTGDPTPFPGAVITRNGQLFFDIVDKSGVYDQTSFGGTIAGGLWRSVVKHAENGVEEIVNAVPLPREPEEYMTATKRLLGTLPAQPWVVYYAGHTPCVKAWSYTTQPSQTVKITTGGESAPGINEAISLS